MLTIIKYNKRQQPKKLNNCIVVKEFVSDHFSQQGPNKWGESFGK